MDQAHVSPAVLQFEPSALSHVPETVEDQILRDLHALLPGLAGVLELVDGPAEGYLKAEFHLSKVGAEKAFATPDAFWAALVEQIPDQIAGDLWPVALYGAGKGRSFAGIVGKTPAKIDMRGGSPECALTWAVSDVHFCYGDTCYQAPPGSLRVRLHRGASVAVAGTKDGGAYVVWRFGISTHVDDPSACILYTNVEVGAGKEGWTMI